MVKIEDLFKEMDKMTPEELARSITNASSKQSQFLVLSYLSHYPVKHEEVQGLLDKNNEVDGTFLEDY